MTPLLGYTVGWIEVVVLGLVILLLFGNRLPTLMRSLGRGVVEFKKGVQGIDDESSDRMDDLGNAPKREPESVDAGRRN